MISTDESSPIPFQPTPPRVHPFDFSRLERKVDKLTEALQELIRFEERQINQEKRISDLETDVGVLRTKIDFQKEIMDKWIQRGITVWVIAGIVFAVFKLYIESGRH